MNFQDFLEYVPKLLDEPLPAQEAHFKMIPFTRIESIKNQDLKSLNPKNAAVMLLLYPKEQKTHLVLIVRNSYDGVHSAQIAFPGGKYEENDQNFRNTALRETQEEIGIDSQSIQIIMPLTNLYIQPSNFMVYPFLGISHEEIIFIPDQVEVAQIIELPLSDFLNDDLVVTTRMSTYYATNIEVPAFQIKEHIVWGATAMILNELKEILKKVI